MKAKNILFPLILLFSISFPVPAADDDKPVKTADLPKKIKEFVSTHLSGKTISYATRDRDSYDVYIESGIKIEFSRKGEWEEISGPDLPDDILELLPEKAKTYLAETSNQKNVRGIKREKYKYEVKLPGDKELIFNKEGTFLGYDD